MKMKAKKYGKMFSIFEFSISKLGYEVIFMKIGGKKFGSPFKTFWLIEAKLKMEMKKFGKMSSIFELSISELGSIELFIKIWEKRFFSKFLPEKRTYYYRGVERVNGS